jgi:hypothetical protein
MKRDLDLDRYLGWINQGVCHSENTYFSEKKDTKQSAFSLNIILFALFL